MPGLAERRCDLESVERRKERIRDGRRRKGRTPFTDLRFNQVCKQLGPEVVDFDKSMIGHSLGAAGAIEAVVCLQTVRTGVIHPTINLNRPAPECDLDYVPKQARLANVRTALSNSFAFGGQNACLVFRAVDGLERGVTSG